MVPFFYLPVLRERHTQNSCRLVCSTVWSMRLHFAPGTRLSSSEFLFVVSTCMVVVETVGTIQETVVFFNSTKTRDFLPFLEFVKHDTLKTVMYAFILLLPVIANAAADFVLIHKCHIVWRYSKRVLVPLLLVSFAVNAVSITGTIMMITGTRDANITLNRVLVEEGQSIAAVGLTMSAPFHLAFTLLTAGRIWWISRPVQRSKAGRRYTFVLRDQLPHTRLHYVSKSSGSVGFRPSKRTFPTDHRPGHQAVVNSRIYLFIPCRSTVFKKAEVYL
ncbi:hypothetical protein L218DRAFT_633452 [Marasmius fiardii PR-910]|nr:hypothetical protein L218DRAFT_633452 [Marasmius fiardii PR-910]